MISCDSFRKRFHVATEDAALLEHVRTCDRCLDFAAHQDPDILFRSLGGEEMIPPGGVDAFVSGVMQQVRVRDAEKATVSQRTHSWARRLAMAAAVGSSVFAATLVYRTNTPAVVATTPVAITAAVRHPLTTKPIVETYESDKATIVEVPTEGTDDVKIVMIIDENLPADL